jgi:hypothetical protein
MLRSYSRPSDTAPGSACIVYSERLADQGVAASIGSIGDASDNSMTEAIINTYKHELLRKRARDPRGLPLAHAQRTLARNARRWTVFRFPTNTLIGAQTWMPAMTVPAGFTDDGLLVGSSLTLPYEEATLFRLGLAFEQATHYRRDPRGPRLSRARKCRARRRSRTPARLRSPEMAAAV